MTRRQLLELLASGKSNPKMRRRIGALRGLDFELRLRHDAPLDSAAFSSRRRVGALRPLKSGVLGDAELEFVVSVVHRLHPLRGVRVSGGEGWITFERPVPWPQFAVLDLAKPFEARVPELSPRLGNLRVAAVGFVAGAMEVVFV